MSHIVAINLDSACSRKYSVYNELISFKPHKAVEIDGIGPDILKLFALLMYKPLYITYSLLALALIIYKILKLFALLMYKSLYITWHPSLFTVYFLVIGQSTVAITPV